MNYICYMLEVKSRRQRYLKKEREFYTVRGYQILDIEKKLLTSSMEDYLEMIYRICIEEGYVRMNQLAEKLNVRTSSTTKIVQKLRGLGLVDYQPYGLIKLTEEGKKLGSFLLKRHEIIEEFLKNLGIEKTLIRDTEMIEHDVSITTLQSIFIMNQFLSENPDVVKRFEDFKEKFCVDRESLL